jgi:hypothetical protein
MVGCTTGIHARRDRGEEAVMSAIRRRRAVLVAAIVLYFTGLGLLGGVAVERMRFDAERDQVLARYEQAAARLRSHLMMIEHDVAARRGDHARR